MQFSHIERISCQSKKIVLQPPHVVFNIISIYFDISRCIMERIYDVIVLFSGGLDSLLTAKILQKQGLRVRCLHFVTSFFGSFANIEMWKKEYDLDIEGVNVSKSYNTMLYNPQHGYGKTLNPCIDCKILLLSTAYTYMKRYNAVCVATGEVLGQRPMSQRKDALNLIEKGSQLEGYLLRPLTAKNLPPTKAEQEGIVDREQLYGFYGRGRTNQLRLAKEFGITKIPSPAGGCSLTVAETASAFYPILEHVKQAENTDYILARSGRQYWFNSYWFILGRNAKDNEKLKQYAGSNDYIITFANHIGTLALIRVHTDALQWNEDLFIDVVHHMIGVSPKVQPSDGDVVQVTLRSSDTERTLDIIYSNTRAQEARARWTKPNWETMKKRAHNKEHVYQQ